MLACVLLTTRSATTRVESESLFGRPGEITPEQNNMGVAVGIGGLPKEAAVYLFYTHFHRFPDAHPEGCPNGDNAFGL